MFNSTKYWDDRYIKGGNSGLGSYNELAQFKADVINDFVEKNQIKSIVDYGVGDGNQLKLFNTENLIYTGIDVSEFIISKCKENFKDDKTKKFIHVDNIDNELKGELVLSCDVIYHLIEEHVYKEYMEKLFSMSKKYVIIYAKNEDINHAVRVKFRIFTTYIEINFPEWSLIKNVANIVKKNASSFYIYKKVENAIITMNLGNRDFINYTKPFMIKYSQKTNSKLIIIDDNNIKNITNSFSGLNEIRIGRNNNKSYIYKVLAIIYYSRIFNKILWVDDTCFIKETCINLYDVIEDNYILAYNEGENKELNSWKNNEEYIKKTTGFSINTNSYINSGVVLYSKDINKILNIDKIIKHKELFNNSYPHQCFLNFIIQYYDIKLKFIPSSYNCMFMNCSYVNGSNIKPENIGNEFILSNENSIFHITGFYKDRLNIVKYIEEILSNEIPFYSNKIQLAKEVIYDIKKNNMSNENVLVFGLGYDSKMWFHQNNKTYFIESNDKYIKLNKDIIPQENIIKYDYKNVTVKNSYKMNIDDMKLYKIPTKILQLAPFKIILIDGPPGYNDEQPGRLIPIYWTRYLSNENTLIYVDDSSRKLETYAINKFFNNNPKIIFNSRLKCTKILFIPPVYISLTSIFINQDILLETLQSIIKQTRQPDKIFLYLSEESYILDTGFKDKKITNSNLLKFINDNSIIDINWVKNTGSYRKLLPLLKEKWDEDCIIITIDDDTVYDTNLIENLINDYNEQKCVIGYRGFTPLFNKLENFNYSKRNKLQHLSLYNFFTGKGGILYKPQFFHKTHDLVFNDKIYLDTCPTGDDIWFYIVRLLNNVKGYLRNTKWQEKNLTRGGLFGTFNSKNDNNTKSFEKTLKKLKELEYKFS